MKRLSLIPLFLAAAAVFGQAAGPEVKLSLTFLGDIMGHDINYRIRDFNDVFAGVKDVLLKDDVTFGNLEFPVDPTLSPEGYPTFNGTRAYWQAAVDSGVDVFSLANNHAFDQGLEGILQTLRSARAVGLTAARPVSCSGVRGNEAVPFAPVEIDAKGVRIGFLAATQFINQYPAQCPNVNIVNLRDKRAADAFVSLVRGESRKYDLFIVSYHGGIEFSSVPDGQLMAFFRRLLDNGAHIIFAHHPHVYQTFGFAISAEGKKVIMPSMGNFISGMTAYVGPEDTNSRWAPTGDSALVCLEVLKTGAGVTITDAKALPISNYFNERREMVVGRLEDLAAGTITLPQAWLSYYRNRMAVMKKRLPPFTLK